MSVIKSAMIDSGNYGRADKQIDTRGTPKVMPPPSLLGRLRSSRPFVSVFSRTAVMSTEKRRWKHPHEEDASDFIQCVLEVPEQQGVWINNKF